MRPLGREIPGRSPGTAQGVERRRRHDRLPAVLHARLTKKSKKMNIKHRPKSLRLSGLTDVCGKVSVYENWPGDGSSVCYVLDL